MRSLPTAARHLAAIPLAALLVVGAVLVPPAAGPAAPLLAPFAAPVARAATDGLAVSSAARYVVRPADALVRVTVDLSLRNQKPNDVAGGAVTRYFYDAVKLGVQPEATNLRATQDGVRVPVDVARARGYRLVTIGLRSSLFYQESASVRLVFDLPGGKPRSSSDVRVGRAFATFLAWAFGDQGSVRIEVPSPYTVDVAGEDMERTVDGGKTILVASTTDPLGWYAWVNARNDAGLTRERLDIAGGEEIVVRGWPEDRAWRREVSDVLRRGVPQLVKRIGLPWPVDGPLNVTEIHTPLLEGYAGFYNAATDEITVSEDLDDFTIVHEASHAWFNNRLFTERWITEGLADEYASRVLVTLGQKRQSPGDVSRSAKVAFPLEDWPPPAPIRNEQSNAREQYGYDASWHVIRLVVKAVGGDGMQAVFKAASDGTTAYVGAGPAERTALPGDWRRFLDLTEELGGATGIGDLLATWALPPGEDAELAARDAARTAYHALLTAGRGWAAPYAVRSELDRWAFGDAEARISEASRILEQRDRTATLAADLGLTPASGLETAYEGARDAAALDAAETLAERGETALEEIAAAGRTAAQPRDWLVSLGLAGEDPDAELTAAREAWSSGDLDAAATHATLAASVLDAAADTGRDRAALIGTGVVLVLVLVAIVVVVVRRRSRRRASPRLTAAPGSPWSPLPPASTWTPPPPPPSPDDAGSPDTPASRAEQEPYATLPASAAPGAQPGSPSSEDEGAAPP